MHPRRRLKSPPDENKIFRERQDSQPKHQKSEKHTVKRAASWKEREEKRRKRETLKQERAKKTLSSLQEISKKREIEREKK